MDNGLKIKIENVNSEICMERDWYNNPLNEELHIKWKDDDGIDEKSDVILNSNNTQFNILVKRALTTHTEVKIEKELKVEIKKDNLEMYLEKQMLNDFGIKQLHEELDLKYDDCDSIDDKYDLILNSNNTQCNTMEQHTLTTHIEVKIENNDLEMCLEKEMLYDFDIKNLHEELDLKYDDDCGIDEKLVVILNSNNMQCNIMDKHALTKHTDVKIDKELKVKIDKEDLKMCLEKEMLSKQLHEELELKCDNDGGIDEKSDVKLNRNNIQCNIMDKNALTTQTEVRIDKELKVKIDKEDLKMCLEKEMLNKQLHEEVELKCDNDGDIEKSDVILNRNNIQCNIMDKHALTTQPEVRIDKELKVKIDKEDLKMCLEKEMLSKQLHEELELKCDNDGGIDAKSDVKLNSNNIQCNIMDKHALTTQEEFRIDKELKVKIENKKLEMCLGKEMLNDYIKQLHEELELKCDNDGGIDEKSDVILNSNHIQCNIMDKHALTTDTEVRIEKELKVNIEKDNLEMCIKKEMLNDYIKQLHEELELKCDNDGGIDEKSDVILNSNHIQCNIMDKHALTIDTEVKIKKELKVNIEKDNSEMCIKKEMLNDYIKQLHEELELKCDNDGGIDEKSDVILNSNNIQCNIMDKHALTSRTEVRIEKELKVNIEKDNLEMCMEKEMLNNFDIKQLHEELDIKSEDDASINENPHPMSNRTNNGISEIEKWDKHDISNEKIKKKLIVQIERMDSKLLGLQKRRLDALDTKVMSNSVVKKKMKMKKNEKFMMHENKNCTDKPKGERKLVKYVSKQDQVDFTHLTIKCKHCNATYKSKQALDYHIIQKHPEFVSKPDQVDFTHLTIKCKHCNATYKSKQALDYHIIQKHPEFVSKPDQVDFTHLTIKCKHCNATYKSKQALDYHMIQKHPEFVSKPDRVDFTHLTIKCKHCDASYKSKQALDYHIIQKHPEFIASVTSKIYECESCTYKCNSKSRCIKHSLKHTTASTYILSKCEHCSATYRSNRSLNDHILKKHPNFIDSVTGKIYECQCCTYKTNKKYKLMRHSLIHPAIAPAHLLRKCKHCHMTYKSKEALNDHITRKHPRFLASVTAKIHECKYCMFKTTFKHSLEKHLLKHPEADLAHLLSKCKHCDMAFKSIQAMNHHIIRKHPNFIDTVTGKIIECKYCPYKTNNKTRLDLHSLKHPGTNLTHLLSKCKQCNATYKSNQGLNGHVIREHPKLIYSLTCKIHECEYCSYKTNDKSHIIRHSLKHRKTSSS